MRKQFMILTSALSLILVQQTGWANQDHQKETMTSEAGMTESIEIKNKICPISGKEIGSMGEGFKVEHNGKTYNLCCSGCERQFKKDPEKFIEIINQELGEKGHDHDEHAHPSRK